MTLTEEQFWAALLEFMRRVDLKGTEALTHVLCVQEIEKRRQALSKAEEAARAA